MDARFGINAGALGGKAKDVPADGPARVVKQGDWGAVPDQGMKGFPMTAFNMPGRALPKPDPADVKLAEMAREKARTTEAHKQALAKAARNGEAAAKAAMAKGRDEGVRDGESRAWKKYEKELAQLRNNASVALDVLQQEKAALFLEFEGQVMELLSASIHRVFDGIASEHAEAVLPLQRRKRALWSMHASPLGTYTALVCGSKLDAGQLDQVRARLASLNLDLASSPFTLNPVALGLPIAAATRVLELASVDADAPAKGWNRNHRRSLATGLETGIQVRRADKPADMQAYYRVYLSLAESWGDKARTVYPERLFRLLWDELGGTPAMELWLGECEGAIVAGRICFYHGFHAVEWHAAALEAYREKGANHVLIHAILAHAKRAGFRIYDFNPNPGLPQVDHFKQGFGAERLEFQASRNFHGLYAGLRALRGR